MSKNKELPDEQKQASALTVHQQMVIADSTSGHEPLPIFEKTLEEEIKITEKFVELFGR